MNEIDLNSSKPIKWQKARRSLGSGACVELASLDDKIVMRDSKDPDGPILSFTHAEIDAFLDGARNGEFDHFVTR